LQTIFNSKLNADGYEVIPSVYSDKTIGLLRNELNKIFNSPPLEGFLNIDNHPRIGSIRMPLLRYDNIVEYIFTEHLIENLKNCFSDKTLKLLSTGKQRICLSPETNIHKNGFGTWHKDTDAQERAGLSFHWKNGYSILQAAIYLQDNFLHGGGGLDVISGSHLIPNPFGLSSSPDERDEWYSNKKFTRVFSKSGDVVIFDTRTDHCASQPHHGIQPKYGDKYGIFFSFGLLDEHSLNYSNFIKNRTDYQPINFSVSEKTASIARKLGFAIYS
jgi:ectoine hydroxylase-related dioxygenase (phytanoyl-CoA dioxygenase family)